MKIYIDLSLYNENRNCLVGKELATKIKQETNFLNQLKISNKICFIINKKINDVSVSFLYSLIENVIKDYGYSFFYEKIDFLCLGEYRIEEDLEEVLDRMKSL